MGKLNVYARGYWIDEFAGESYTLTGESDDTNVHYSHIVNVNDDTTKLVLTCATQFNINGTNGEFTNYKLGASDTGTWGLSYVKDSLLAEVETEYGYNAKLIVIDELGKLGLLKNNICLTADVHKDFLTSPYYRGYSSDTVGILDVDTSDSDVFWAVTDLANTSNKFNVDGVLFSNIAFDGSILFDDDFYANWHSYNYSQLFEKLYSDATRPDYLNTNGNTNTYFSSYNMVELIYNLCLGIHNGTIRNANANKYAVYSKLTIDRRLNSGLFELIPNNPELWSDTILNIILTPRKDDGVVVKDNTTFIVNEKATHIIKKLGSAKEYKFALTDLAKNVVNESVQQWIADGQEKKEYTTYYVYWFFTTLGVDGKTHTTSACVEPLTISPYMMAEGVRPATILDTGFDTVISTQTYNRPITLNEYTQYVEVAVKDYIDLMLTDVFDIKEFFENYLNATESVMILGNIVIPYYTQKEVVAEFNALAYIPEPDGSYGTIHIYTSDDPTNIYEPTYNPDNDLPESDTPEPTTPNYPTTTPTPNPNNPTMPEESVSNTPIPPHVIVTPQLASQIATTYEFNGLVDVNNFIMWLWTLDDDLLNNLKRLRTDPLENVVSFKMFPCGFPHAEESNGIVLGSIKCDDVLAYDITNARIIDCGNMTIKPLYNNFLDFAFTDVQIYIPFHGMEYLDLTKCMGQTINLTYYIDPLTGMGRAQITNVNGNTLIAEYECTMSQDVPLSGSDFLQHMSNLMLNLGGMAVSIGTGNILGGITSGLSSALNPYHTQINGHFSANTQFMVNCKPYIVYNRPVWQNSSKYAHTYGRPCNLTYTLSDLSGFTTIASGTDYSGINATESELEEIKSILESGVYL